MANNDPQVPWTTHLPHILAGLRFLPTKLGVPPAWLVYKQDLQSLPETLGVSLGGENCLEEATGDEQAQLLGE